MAAGVRPQTFGGVAGEKGTEAFVTERKVPQVLRCTKPQNLFVKHPLRHISFHNPEHGKETHLVDNFDGHVCDISPPFDISDHPRQGAMLARLVAII